MTAPEFVAMLDAVEETSGGWTALCPAPNDTTPSLSVTEGEDERVLIHCHAGCPPDAIVAALGLTMADLFPRRRSWTPRSTPTKPARRLVGTYVYIDEEGQSLFEVCRYTPKDFRQRHRKPDGQWEWSLRDVRRVLYHLPQVNEAVKGGTTVFVVEGEKDADTLFSLGFTATTNAGGAGKWRAEYSEFLQGARVVILPDNDTAGHQHAERVARSLQGKAADIKIIHLPALPPKGDVSDWLAAGGTRQELDRLVAESPTWTPGDDAAEEDALGEAQASANTNQSQAQVLVALGESAPVELFHTPAGNAYATYPVREHRETSPIFAKPGSTTAFGRWLVHRYHTTFAGTPRAQAVADALGTLAAKALHDGAEYDVHTRIAAADGAIYLDLTNANWQAVRITAEGWSIIPDPPVKFRRSPNAAPLPDPTRGGSVKALRPYINVATQDDFILIVGFILGALRPDVPYPVLVLTGEHGSSKSTLARVVRALVDPVRDAAARALPRSEHDLAIAAHNAHLLAFSNISKFPDWASDALARISTREGFATRELYTDDGEVIFGGGRPICLNGISNFVQRADLLSRAIVLDLPSIADNRRRDETTFWAEFEHVRPAILGALLDAVVVALRHIGTVRRRHLPRMADFAKWVIAAEPALPWGRGRFERAYRDNQRIAIDIEIEGSIVADAVRRWVGTEEIVNWEGTASELLVNLSRLVPEPNQRRQNWPENAQALSSQLKRDLPALRQQGIHLTLGNRKGKLRTRKIVVEVVRSRPYGDPDSSETPTPRPPTATASAQKPRRRR